MSNPTKKTRTNLPLYLSIAVVGSLVAAYFMIPEVQDFLKGAWKVLTSGDEQRIQSWVKGFGWLGPVVLVFSMIAQMFLIIIPSVLLMVVTILAYGPIWGSVIIMIAIFSASTVGYGIGRYFGEKIVLKLLGGKTGNKIEGFISDYGFWAVIVTRLNPFLSNDAISFVGGMLRMSYWKFIAATLVGITPLTVLIAYLGENTGTMKPGLLGVSVVSLVIFISYVVWNQRRKLCINS